MEPFSFLGTISCFTWHLKKLSVITLNLAGYELAPYLHVSTSRNFRPPRIRSRPQAQPQPHPDSQKNRATTRTTPHLHDCALSFHSFLSNFFSQRFLLLLFGPKTLSLGVKKINILSFSSFKKIGY